MILRIAKWLEYQHYKDRRPPWIKLHYSLLSSETWVMLKDSERVLAIACMLVASQSELADGAFSANPDYIKRVAYLDKKPDFKPLIRQGFLEVVEGDASGCKRTLADDTTETEAYKEEAYKEEAEAETRCLIISDLNARVSGKFRATTVATAEAINARTKEGATLADFYLIHEHKALEWLTHPKYSAFLRPATLYAPSKFEGYLTEAQRWADAGRPELQASKPEPHWSDEA